MICKDCWKIFGAFFVVSLVVFSWSGVDFSRLNLNGGLTGFVVNEGSLVTVSLNNGWNLVSVPFKSFSVIGCDSEDDSVWAIHYDSLKGGYGSWIGRDDFVSENGLRGGLGYWVYYESEVSESCILSFYGSDPFALSYLGDNKDGTLISGANMIGATTESTKLSDVAGDCAFGDASLISYDTSKSDYVYAKELTPGKGYWIINDAENSCKLKVQAIIEEKKIIFSSQKLDLDSIKETLGWGYMWMMDSSVVKLENGDYYMVLRGIREKIDTASKEKYNAVAFALIKSSDKGKTWSVKSTKEDEYTFSLTEGTAQYAETAPVDPRPGDTYALYTYKAKIRNKKGKGNLSIWDVYVYSLYNTDSYSIDSGETIKTTYTYFITYGTDPNGKRYVKEKGWKSNSETYSYIQYPSYSQEIRNGIDNALGKKEGSSVPKYYLIEDNSEISIGDGKISGGLIQDSEKSMYYDYYTKDWKQKVVKISKSGVQFFEYPEKVTNYQEYVLKKFVGLDDNFYLLTYSGWNPKTFRIWKLESGTFVSKITFGYKFTGKNSTSSESPSVQVDADGILHAVFDVQNGDVFYSYLSLTDPVKSIEGVKLDFPRGNTRYPNSKVFINQNNDAFIIIKQRNDTADKFNLLLAKPNKQKGELSTEKNNFEISFLKEFPKMYAYQVQILNSNWPQSNRISNPQDLKMIYQKNENGIWYYYLETPE